MLNHSRYLLVMKENILEEIKKIQEIMGVNATILTEAPVGQQPWLFNMVDDFIKTLFKDDERYEDAWRLLSDYRKKQSDYNQLSPQQKADAKLDLNPETWRRGLSDDEKKLLKSAETIESLNRSKTDIDSLKDVINRGQRLEPISNSEQAFLDDFISTIFKNKSTLDDAVKSFYKKNQKASVWQDVWNNRKLSEFNSESSIDDWGDRLKLNIENENSIPDYLKEVLEKEIDIAVQNLKDRFIRFNEIVMTSEVRKLMKKYNLNYDSNLNWYERIVDFLLGPVTGYDKLAWGKSVSGTGKKVQTSVSKVLKELFELSEKNTDLNFNELVDLAFSMAKYKGNSLTSEESL